MPTIDEVTKILSCMDKETYSAAVKFIYYLMSDSDKNNSEMINQKRFLKETAGKISVDEDAVSRLRMESMI